jgi:hypothetical protein
MSWTRALGNAAPGSDPGPGPKPPREKILMGTSKFGLRMAWKEEASAKQYAIYQRFIETTDMNDEFNPIRGTYAQKIES